MKYYLILKAKNELVSKQFFLATIGVPERTVRTALAKQNSIGIVEPDFRGGRKRNELVLQKEK